jgi:hypothetical protein
MSIGICYNSSKSWNSSGIMRGDRISNSRCSSNRSRRGGKGNGNSSSRSCNSNGGSRYSSSSCSSHRGSISRSNIRWGSGSNSGG